MSNTTDQTAEIEVELSVPVTILVPVRVKARYTSEIDVHHKATGTDLLGISIESLDPEIDETPSYIASLVANQLREGVGEEAMEAAARAAIHEEYDTTPDRTEDE